MDDPLQLIPALSADLVAAFAQAGAKIATAESCTGGMIAAAITDIAGASAVLDRGFVTYSNEAKIEMLGVDGVLIERLGAVSTEVACAMADGALARSNADIAVSVTGIAGPDGGSDAKPVGLVCFGVASAFGSTLAVERRFDDRGRAHIRAMSAMMALQLLIGTLEQIPVAGAAQP